MDKDRSRVCGRRVHTSIGSGSIRDGLKAVRQLHDVWRNA